MNGAPRKLSARVVAALRGGGPGQAPWLAKKLMCTRHQISAVLAVLRDAGTLRVDGYGSGARWTVVGT